MNINEVLLSRYVSEIGKNLRCEAFWKFHYKAEKQFYVRKKVKNNTFQSPTGILGYRSGILYFIL